MFKKYCFILVAASMFSASASAEQWMPNHWYVDGGLGTVKFDDGYDQINPMNIYIRGGYYISQNFNIGIESNVTIAPDNLYGVDYRVNIGTVYFRAGVPVGPTAMVYGQIGSSNTELSGSLGSLTASVSDRDTMLGAGAEFGLGYGPTSTTYLAINYSQYNNNSGVTVTGFTVGIGARF